jgi:hypothetical protein
LKNEVVLNIREIDKNALEVATKDNGIIIVNRKRKKI